MRPWKAFFFREATFHRPLTDVGREGYDIGVHQFSHSHGMITEVSSRQISQNHFEFPF